MKGRLLAGLGLIALLSTAPLADTLPNGTDKTDKERCSITSAYWLTIAGKQNALGVFRAGDKAFNALLKSANERRAEWGYSPWQAKYLLVDVWADGSVVIGMFDDTCVIKDSVAMFNKSQWAAKMKSFNLTADDFELIEEPGTAPGKKVSI